MKSKPMSRRDFMRGGAVVTAGVAAGLGSARSQGVPGAVKPSQILNYKQDMEYRRLGKTDLMVSAVCLGGHSRSDEKERYEIISRCIDAGINYIDACTGREVLRDAKALKGRRDKMYLGFSNIGMEPRKEDFRTAKSMMKGLDDLLKEANLEYADIWRITCLEPGGRHTFNTSLEIAEVLEQAKKQGKVRFGGFSSHDRRWIKFMIEYFPQNDVVCFPFTTMTKTAPKDSLFASLKKCDVGAFGIKPFAAASLFKDNPVEDNRRARLAIRYILHSNTVIPIPGLNSIDEVDNAVKAVMERRELDLKEKAELAGAGREMWAKLPPNYRWLKDWEYV
jgi:aryl-alcohol dehydrogenase-like predicted oxidoreductase